VLWRKPVIGLMKRELFIIPPPVEAIGTNVEVKLAAANKAKFPAPLLLLIFHVTAGVELEPAKPAALTTEWVEVVGPTMTPFVVSILTWELAEVKVAPPAERLPVFDPFVADTEPVVKFRLLPFNANGPENVWSPVKFKRAKAPSLVVSTVANSWVPLHPILMMFDNWPIPVPCWTGVNPKLAMADWQFVPLDRQIVFNAGPLIIAPPVDATGTIPDVRLLAVRELKVFAAVKVLAAFRRGTLEIAMPELLTPPEPLPERRLGVAGMDTPPGQLAPLDKQRVLRAGPFIIPPAVVATGTNPEVRLLAVKEPKVEGKGMETLWFPEQTPGFAKVKVLEGLVPAPSTTVQVKESDSPKLAFQQLPLSINGKELKLVDDVATPDEFTFTFAAPANKAVVARLLALTACALTFTNVLIAPVKVLFAFRRGMLAKGKPESFTPPVPFPTSTLVVEGMLLDPGQFVPFDKQTVFMAKPELLTPPIPFPDRRLSVEGILALPGQLVPLERQIVLSGGPFVSNPPVPPMIRFPKASEETATLVGVIAPKPTVSTGLVVGVVTLVVTPW
jgi:hypothetical protein